MRLKTLKTALAKNIRAVETRYFYSADILDFWILSLRRLSLD